MRLDGLWACFPASGRLRALATHATHGAGGTPPPSQLAEMPIASRVAAELLRVLPRKKISHVMGRLADLKAPPPLVRHSIRAFVRAYGVDMDEAVVPDGGFDSFDAFFTRELRSGARTPDARPEAIVSPADGRVEDLGAIDSDARFLVKGFEYTVAELLGSEQEAKRFHGGIFFIVYLSPRDYHRVHAAVDGHVIRTRHVDGTLLPVNAIGLAHFPKLFARNERVVTLQDTRFGQAASVMVGAFGVGSITLSFDERVVTNSGRPARSFEYGDAGPVLKRGGELGRFHLGSTVVMLLGPGHEYSFCVAPGAQVRMGQAIALGRSAS
jgi:phosphatidylserine decarboxylase